MKALSGFVAEPSGKSQRQLPVGDYVARIKATKIDGDEPDQQLVFRLDVEEGEYKNYFFNRFTNDSKNSRFEPKYKGIYRLRIPNPDNTKAQYPDNDLRRFKDAIYRIEQSNPGYHWEWDENSLKGLLIGIHMKEDSYNGYNFTKIGWLVTVDEARNGNTQTHQMGDADDTQFIDKKSGFTAVETDELPF